MLGRWVGLHSTPVYCRTGGILGVSKRLASALHALNPMSGEADAKHETAVFMKNPLSCHSDQEKPDRLPEARASLKKSPDPTAFLWVSKGFIPLQSKCGCFSAAWMRRLSDFAALFLVLADLSPTIRGFHSKGGGQSLQNYGCCRENCGATRERCGSEFDFCGDRPGPSSFKPKLVEGEFS